MTDPDQLRLRRVLGIIGNPQGQHILDLACRIGVFSTALAQAGAHVLGVEGRQENLDQAPASNARYIVGDVRKLPSDLGPFDWALCLGILYHLTAAEALELLAALRGMTSRVIVDTHISNGPETVTVGSHEYAGYTYPEPKSLWASLDSDPSWWFSIESLNDVFGRTGWISYQVHGSAYPMEPTDRVWFTLEAA